MKLIGYGKARGGGGGSPHPLTDVRETSGEGRSKILAVAMFVMVLMATSTTIFVSDETVAEDGWTTYQDIQWKVDVNTLKIKGNGASWDVTGDLPWNSSISSIIYVEIESGVKSIGENAFKGCTKLAQAKIPGSVESIGNSAFYGCTDLDTVLIEDGVKKIGQRAFAGCSGLGCITSGTSTTSAGRFTLPETVTTIGEEAFRNCRSLFSIEIPSLVTSIERETFYGCTYLDTVTIGGSVGTIGVHAFNGCTSLTTINLSSTQTIGDYAFDDCTSLASVDISQATTIGNCAFYNCGLTSIAFADGVAIGTGAFTQCTALKEIRFPASIAAIGTTGSWAFGSHSFYATESSEIQLVQYEVANFAGYTYVGETVNRMVRGGSSPSPSPVDPTDPDTDGGSDSPTFIPLPDNRGDNFPGYVPVQKTGNTSDDSSYAAVIVGVIAAILAIMVVLLYRKD